MSSAPAPSTSRRAAALPAEQRRAAIVEATLPLLVSHGERVTTRQIAEASGIAEGTIFGVFADKDELLSVVLEAAMDMSELERTLAAIDPTLPFESQLIEATAAIQRRAADIWQLVSNVGPRLQTQARRPFRDSPGMTALFERHPECISVPPAEAARLVRALIVSLTHPLVGGSPTGPETIVDTLLHGIGARS